MFDGSKNAAWMIRRIAKRFRKARREEQGQSMVEFAIAAPVLVVFLYAIWFISDLYLVKYETLMAARYVTWRLAKVDDLGGGRLGMALRAYYFDDDDRMSFETVPADDVAVTPISDFLSDVFAGKLRPTTFAMKVSYNVAPRFRGLDVSEENPEGFTIASTHYVGGNSWHGCRTTIHEMYGLFYNYVRRLSDLF